ncbi:hypothetical protein DTO166G4_8260 [Paecilomyces variotii]|nr:hypothetical protein DTO166G4_8260 [Paecilomyces variotii]
MPSKQAEKLATESSVIVDQQDAPAFDNTEAISVPAVGAEKAGQNANNLELPAQEPVSAPEKEQDAPESIAEFTEAPEAPEASEPAIEDKRVDLSMAVPAQDAAAQPSEANTKQLRDEQQKKSKKKGKKNRKSVNFSEPEQEPKQSDVVVDAAQAQTPQPSGEAAEIINDDVDQAAPAATTEVGALELLGAETVHRQISNVENDETNDREPHVSPQIKPDSEPQDDSFGATTSTGQNNETDKNAEDPQSAGQDETGNAPAAVTVAEADTTAVPVGEDTPSGPVPPAIEETKPIEEEAVKEPVVEPTKEALPQEEVPMTPAQKRKAKKDKKKRQSLKEEDTPALETTEQPVSEPATPAAEETPVVPDSPVGEKPEEGDVTQEEQPVTEQEEPKDGNGEGVDEFQSAKSKKKAKKDKKKRQSLALSDDPSAPTTTEDLAEAVQAAAEVSTAQGPTTEGPTTEGPTTEGPTTEGPTTEGSATAVEQPDQSEETAQEPPAVELVPAAQEEQPVPEQAVPEAEAVEDTPKAPVEEFSSPKSKKKTKKDKKKRQSLAIAEEAPATADATEAAPPADEITPAVESPSAPLVETEGIEQPSLETAVVEVPVSEEVPKEQTEGVTIAEPKEEAQTSEPYEENALAQQDKPVPGAAHEEHQQSTTEEPAFPAVDEFQPSKSKKKGKKGKKNRASIGQAEEVQDEAEKQPTEVGTVGQTKEEQPPTESSLEQATGAINIPADASEEKSIEESRDERSEEPTAISSEDVGSANADNEATVVAEAVHAVPDNNIQETEAAESEIRKDEQTNDKPSFPDVTLESTAESATDPTVEPTADVATEYAVDTGTEPTTESKDQSALEAEPDLEFTSLTSKKKSKKDKKKRQPADWTEEIPTATPNEVSRVEGEDKDEKPDTSITQTEETTPSTKAPDEDGDGFMSAKGKRKAKKDKKKRQSVTWEDENLAAPTEPTTAAEDKPAEEVEISREAQRATERDISQDAPVITTSADENASAEEPKPVETLLPPQETPAEYDGKENQSSEEKKTGDVEKEPHWTDEMASSQAEQQKEMPPVLPHQPPSESIEPEMPTPNTPVTEPDHTETARQGIEFGEKEREEPKQGEQGSIPGEDEGTYSVTSTKKSKKEKKKKKRESASLPDEPSTAADASFDAENVEQSALEGIYTGDVEPSETVPEDQPATGVDDTGILEPSNPEQPPTAAAEDLWPSPTSQKKKGKKDKRNKKKQETVELQDDNVDSRAETAEQILAEAPEAPFTPEDVTATDKEAGVAAEEIPAEPSKEAELEQAVPADKEEPPPESQQLEPTGTEVIAENEKEIPSPAQVAEFESKQNDMVEVEDQAASVPAEGAINSAEQPAGSHSTEPVSDDVKETMEAQPEETWAIPSKKKKKDKKKRASLRDETAAAPETEEQPSLTDAATPTTIEPGHDSTVENVEGQQATEKMPEEPGEDFWAVSTKKGKKKGKRGKSSKDMSTTLPLETAEPKEELVHPVDEGLATPLDNVQAGEDLAGPPAAEEGISVLPDDISISPEPVQPSISLDPFDVPSDAENAAENSTANGANDANELADLGLDPPADEALRKAQEESEDRLRRRALEQDSDLTLAEDLFGDRPKEIAPESPSTKKSKGKKKSLQRAIPDENEDTPEPATDTMGLAAEEQESEGGLQEEPSALEKSRYDEMLLNRSSSKKKNKKKRKDTISLEPEELKSKDTVKEVQSEAETEKSTLVQKQDTAPTGELDPYSNDDSWPPIEWDEDTMDAVNQNLEEQAETEEPPEEFPIVFVDHGPGVIGDFADTPRIEELREETKQLEEPSGEDIWAAPLSKKDKKKNKKKTEAQEKAVAGTCEDEELAAPEQPLPTPEPAVVEPRISEAPTPVVAGEAEDPDESWPTTLKKGKKGKKSERQSQYPPEEQPADVEEKASEKVKDEADENRKDEEKQTEEKAEVKDTEEKTADEVETNMEEVVSVPAPEPTPIISIDEKPREISLPPKTSKIASIFPNLERASFKRPVPRPSSEKLTESKEWWKHPKEVAEDETIGTDASRASAIQVSEAPLAEDAQSLRDSGHAATEQRTGNSAHWQDEKGEPDLSTAGKKMHRKTPPVEASSQDRPSTPKQSGGLHRTTSIHGHHHHDGHLLPWSLDQEKSDAPRSLFGGPVGINSDVVTPPRTPLGTIREHDEEAPRRTAGGSGTPKLSMGPEHRLPPPATPSITDDALSTDDQLNRPRSRAPAQQLNTPEQRTPVVRPSSVGSIGSIGSINSRRSTGTPPLRRVSRNLSGDLRAASRLEEEKEKEKEEAGRRSSDYSRAAEDELVNLPSSSTYDPVTDKGKRPVRVMADVYEGWGETPSSPRSPSRPPSVRRRRSMQYLQELETRLDQLISENRLLAAARDEAENKIRTLRSARRKSDNALNRSDADLRDKEAEITQLKNSLDWMQKEVARLTEENEGLTATNAGLEAAHHQELKEAREASSRELEELRSQHQQLSTGMEDIVRHEIESALAQKNEELRLLRTELAATRDKVQELQLQITASLPEDDVIVSRDEDYFDAACQKLCQHVQQWVLRFSKHSDLRRCRLLSEINDEKIADRFDNAILDGSDVDSYLADRVRRRDVFMSVVMTMVWEYIFTRYLFGMDREQRQKLKTLEKQLAEVGSRCAVSRWRATTLTLLARRPAFARQRLNDTEAVALEIFGTLSRLLPPPSAVEGTLLDSLRNVLRVAADLSIEMRTQRAEYVMLPPLQPEFDANGDLARQVYFNASLMNERSGQTTSNEELEAQQAVVRLVLFPLVVKKGNDLGEGDEEIVVCPAQVLVARPSTEKKVVRVLSGDRMSIDAPSAMSNMI